MLEEIKEPLVLFIYTKYRHGKGLHIPKCSLSQKCKNVWKKFPGLQYAYNLRIKYTFPEYVFHNHMLQNEAILRKSISDERKWGEMLETYLKY